MNTGRRRRARRRARAMEGARGRGNFCVVDRASRIGGWLARASRGDDAVRRRRFAFSVRASRARVARARATAEADGGGGDDAQVFERVIGDARVERAREGDDVAAEDEKDGARDARASSALDVAVKPLSRAVTRVIFKSRGTEELFHPEMSTDVLERFVEPDVDEELVAKSAEAERVTKCGTRKRGYSDVVLLQAFDWLSARRAADRGKSYYRRIEDQIDTIADFGFSHVWLPPPSLSVDEQGYMPVELYNLNASEYGDEAELKSLVSSLRARGISAVCDIVINHRCATYSSDNTFVSFADELTPSGRKINWGDYAIVKDDPAFEGTGSNDSGDSIAIAPDLDHENPEIRDALVEWMQWLQTEVGFTSWRFDFVQGYAPKFAREYVEKTVGFENFCVGEFWVGMRWGMGATLDYNQDKPRRVLMDWLKASNEAMALFDFPTKGILQEAVKRQEFWRLRDSRGGMPGLAGWAPQLAVTFIDNHDSGYPQNHWPFPQDRLGLGYAYIITHPGIVCVFGDHIWCKDEHYCPSNTLKGEIQALLNCRKLAGICCESTVSIKIAESDLYVASIDDKVVVKLGSRYEVPDDVLVELKEYALVTHGDDYAVWLRNDLLEIDAFQSQDEGLEASS